MENKNEVTLAVGGAIYKLDEGAPAPTDVHATLTGILGFTSEDGVELTPSDDVSEIAAWPRGEIIRTTHTNGKVEITFTLYQDSEDTNKLYFAGDENGNGAFVLNASKYGGTFPLAIRTIDMEQGSQTLWVAPQAQLTSRGSITLNHTTVTAYEVTLTARYDAEIDGQIAKYTGVWPSPASAGE